MQKANEKLKIQEVPKQKTKTDMTPTVLCPLQEFSESTDRLSQTPFHSEGTTRPRTEAH